MAQIFPRNANMLARLSVIGVILLVAVLIGVLWFFTRSAWARQVGEPIPQPVPFSHAFHVGGLQMNCQYCHSRVEESGFANIPSTETCMACHSVIRTDSVNLQPVRDSWENNEPIEWNKVHDVPDFVYFNHSIHIDKGVGCSTCHGRVDQMVVVAKTEPLFMSWCLDCHREPEKYVRPQSEIYNMAWEPPPNQLEVGRQLVEEYGIRSATQLTNCSICHR